MRKADQQKSSPENKIELNLDLPTCYQQIGALRLPTELDATPLDLTQSKRMALSMCYRACSLYLSAMCMRINAERRGAVLTEGRQCSRNEAHEIHFNPDSGRKTATIALLALTDDAGILKIAQIAKFDRCCCVSLEGVIDLNRYRPS